MARKSLAAQKPVLRANREGRVSRVVKIHPALFIRKSLSGSGKIVIGGVIL
jgi:hypothetical protein